MSNVQSKFSYSQIPYNTTQTNFGNFDSNFNDTNTSYYSNYNYYYESILWLFNDVNSRIHSLPYDIKGYLLDFIEKDSQWWTTAFYRQKIMWELEIQNELNHIEIK